MESTHGTGRLSFGAGIVLSSQREWGGLRLDEKVQRQTIFFLRTFHFYGFTMDDHVVAPQ